MFPLSDDNPRNRLPIATIVLIALNVLVWVFVQGLGNVDALARSLCLYGLIPGDLLGTVVPGTRMPISETLVCVLDGDGSPTALVSSMFMHGGWFHIVGNLWFLWVFGDNVEDVMGPVRFVVFYLLWGLAAAGDYVYATLSIDGPVEKIDAASGTTLHEYQGSDRAEEILVDDGLMFALTRESSSELADYAPAFNTGDQRRVRTEFVWQQAPRQIRAYNAESGCNFTPLKFVAEEDEELWMCTCKLSEDDRGLCDESHWAL